MVPLGRSATSGESSSTPARRRAPLLPETTKTGAAGPPAVWARPASMSVLPARDGNQLDRDGAGDGAGAGAALGCASMSFAGAGWAGAGGASRSVSAGAFAAFFVGPLNQFDPVLLAFAGAGRGAALALLATGARPLALFAGAGAAVGPAATPSPSRNAVVTGPNDFQFASASGVA